MANVAGISSGSAGRDRSRATRRERGSTLVETSIVMFPCLMILMIFLVVSEGLYSVALVTSDAVQGRIGREMWRDANVGVDMLLVGHPTGHKASLPLPNDLEARQKMMLFANVVAGKVHFDRKEAFGFTTSPSWNYRQTTVESSVERRTLAAGVGGMIDTSIGTEYVIWESVKRRYFPMVHGAAITASVGSVKR